MTMPRTTPSSGGIVSLAAGTMSPSRHCSSGGFCAGAIPVAGPNVRQTAASKIFLGRTSLACLHLDDTHDPLYLTPGRWTRAETSDAGRRKKGVQ